VIGLDWNWNCVDARESRTVSLRNATFQNVLRADAILMHDNSSSHFGSFSALVGSKVTLLVTPVWGVDALVSKSTSK